MIDQSTLDLCRLIGGNLHRVAGTNGGEYAGACPFCGGEDRFRVWPQADPPRWWCRRCDLQGDAIAFVRRRDGVSFQAALEMLGLTGQAPVGRGYPDVVARPVRPPEPLDPPLERWQAAARAFVADSCAHLHGRYRKPLAWLHQRGYRDATIQYGQLGYHPGVGVHGDQCYVPRSAWGLPDVPSGDADGTVRTTIWLPRGIVLPVFAAGHLWKLFIRRPITAACWEAVRRPPPHAAVPAGVATDVVRCLRERRTYATETQLAHWCHLDVTEIRRVLDALHACKLVRRPTKHYQVLGGRNSIYNADAIQPGKPVLLVEAALDALAVHQEAGDLCAAVATGTTGGRTIRWAAQVARATVALLGYDNDGGGDSPVAYWRDVLREKAFIWRPYLDDPAAMLEQGMDVRGWVAAGVLAAVPPDPTTLDDRIFAAVAMGDHALAAALAVSHPDSDGVRTFLAAWQQANAPDATD